jgi:hypothetical protein
MNWQHGCPFSGSARRRMHHRLPPAAFGILTGRNTVLGQGRSARQSSSGRALFGVIRTSFILQHLVSARKDFLGRKSGGASRGFAHAGNRPPHPAAVASGRPHRVGLQSRRKIRPNCEPKTELSRPCGWKILAHAGPVDATQLTASHGCPRANTCGRPRCSAEFSSPAPTESFAAIHPGIGMLFAPIPITWFV